MIRQIKQTFQTFSSCVLSCGFNRSFPRVDFVGEFVVFLLFAPSRGDCSMFMLV